MADDLNANRRRFVQWLAAVAAFAASGSGQTTFAAEGNGSGNGSGQTTSGGNGGLTTSQDVLTFGPPSQFTFEGLIEEARLLAGQPYQPVVAHHRDILEQIDWAAHGQIHFKPEDCLFAKGPGQYPIAFFHPGKFFPFPVRMYRLESASGATSGATGGQTSSPPKSGQTPNSATSGQTTSFIAREVLYDKQLFDMPPDSPAQKLDNTTGFAGFRVQESRLSDQARLDWRYNDWAAFLGASYFRAIGDQYQYGLSARGIALDVVVEGQQEEFPNFTRFYFEPQQDGSNTIVVYAFLESASIAGAYRFAMTRATSVVMDVETRLFLRRDVSRFGIAPLTSMYWFGKGDKDRAMDWRPEVHDSDGLALWTGNGEHVWRPLNDPPRIMVSSFSDNNPRGFGLMQRERRFDEYLDGVHYERRPGLWIEPLDNWGEGSVQLVELPTQEEIYDNIVAMWVPKIKALAGSSYSLRYRLYWQAEEPAPFTLARCVATRIGRAGRQPGPPRPKGGRKFVVEFKGGPLLQLGAGQVPESVVTASRGRISDVYVEPIPNGETGHWRAFFDWVGMEQVGDMGSDHFSQSGSDHFQEPVELRLFLRFQEATLTETWLFQYHPV